MSKGKVWLLGAGPGDAMLLTLGALAVLEQADVVVYDALVGPGVLAMIPEHARLVNVGKRAGNHHAPQEEINRILLREALAGNRVARLKGGDPFVFGRGGEELELLVEHGVPFEVVPGVTSAVAVPAYAGIPVTHRDCASSFHVITGHKKSTREESPSQKENSPGEADVDYEALVRMGGTFLFLMGLAMLPRIRAGLLAAGMNPSTPTAVLERGTTARQQRCISTLEALERDVKAMNIQPPAILVVGEVCALAQRFHWAEDRPLGNLRVAVTRPRGLISGLTSRLRELGAEVLELPALSTKLIWPNAAFTKALAHASEYGWLTVTSPSGANHLLEALRAANTDIRVLCGVELAAVGAATKKALEAQGLLCALTPERFGAPELGAELAARAQGKRVLLLRAREASPGLTQALDEAGVEYDDIPLYETATTGEAGRENGPVPELAAAIREGVDCAAFASASAVRGFVQALGAGFDCGGICAVCIGVQTAAEAAKHGMVTTTAREATMDSLVESIVELAKEQAARNQQ